MRRRTRLPPELPDVRDGLTATQRIVLTTLNEMKRESGRESIPVIELWGRLSETVNLSQAELQRLLQQMGARR